MNIKLTDKGREVLSQAMPVPKEVVNQVMISITEGKAVMFKENLTILRKNAHYRLEDLAGRAESQPG